MGAVLLAAGAGRRMRGGDKLLEPVAQGPLLRVLADRLTQAAVAPLAATLPCGMGRGLARADVLTGSAVEVLETPDATEGMSASLRRAALWAGDQGLAGLMIVPADMPELTAADFAALHAAFCAAPERALRATAADGTPGHPVVFPAQLFPALASLSGDQGARAILARHAPRLLPLPARHALTDLDTPEAWAAWRAEQR
jgi:molybdenum cofactor cytidylyltransferase